MKNFYDRIIWLKAQERKESDVMEDDGGEYYLSENEDGSFSKVYLPIELQRQNLDLDY